MNVLVWLKRDLRLHDHPALVLAAALGPVLPVFVVEPGFWAQPDASARHWGFVAESLEDLRDELTGIGLPLIVRIGDAVTVLERLCRQHRIRRIVSHTEAGTAWSQARDLRVAEWAKGAGIEWTVVPQPDLAGPVLLPPALIAVQGGEPGVIPSARALRLVEDRCPHRQLGGRARGLELLDGFLTRRGEGYRTAQASPLSAERASSRLSPHLAWGTLSAREVAEATALRQAERPGGRWAGALSGFQSRLALREQTLRQDDRTNPDARSQPNASRQQAWEAGETGVPFLDATLRYLAATGWLSAPSRAMVASFALHQLGLDWQATGQHLARSFTDYDPGLLWLHLPTGNPRPVNPVKQGLAQDPAGAFIRAWLPELTQVPDAFLHEPWKWPGARRLLGHRYPEPVVDLATAAREALRAARTTQGFAAGAPRRIKRPAGPDCVIEGPPRRAKPAQLSLDL